MEKKIIVRNIAFSLMLQLVTVASGFILPKIIITAFGSQTNGLVSSITQFLNYITLLEGGLSGVITASLYKPLQEGDQRKISGVVHAARRFFKRLSVIFVLYVAVLAFLYPIIVKTGFSYEYVSALILVLGSGLFVQYFFSITYRLLLTADRKVYIVSALQAFFVIVNVIISLLCVKWFHDILILKWISGLVFLLQPLLFRVCVKKYFQLDKTVPPDTGALKQRWDGFGQNIAYFIHNNTDIVLVTLFCNLETVSVYAVHLMIINALKSVFTAFTSAMTPSLGRVMAQNDLQRSNRAFDLYEFGTTALATLMFTCGIVLIVPFVSVYTATVADVNYRAPLFAILLTTAEMIYCFRDPYVAVSYIAGHFKQTAKFAYAEAGLNMAISLLLVHRFGIVGVATGTLVAMIYRMLAQVWYLKKNILYRPLRIFAKKWGIFAAITLIVALSSTLWVPLTMNNYLSWVGYAVAVFLLCTVLLLVASMLFFRNDLKTLLKRKL